MRQQSYNHIVSLGRDCLPRTVPTRQGYKLTKAQGELTLPFDLALHDYDGLCQIIESNFKDYCKPDFLGVTEDGCIENTKYNVRFNHESLYGRHDIYRANKFEKLIEKYEARIANFYRYVADDNIIFICEYQIYPGRLNQVIKSVFPNLTYKIVTLNTFFPKEFSMSYFYPVEVYEQEIDYYSLPFPSDDYAWWEPQHFTSDAGVKFENRIGDIISKYVNRVNSQGFENGF